MAFFKTKEEKEIMAKMEREEAMQLFNDQINELKGKQKEYARIAAEAEVNGDTGSYDLAVNALIEMNECMSSLIQTKTNFDIINVSNSISINMAMAMNALVKMTDGKNQLPDLRKIQKAQLKMQKYMREIKVSRQAMANAMNRANPANKARSEADISAVKSLIDAERAKIAPSAPVGGMSLADEIAKEKNKLYEG